MLENAECKSVGTEVFFAEKGNSSSTKVIVRTWCAKCVVRLECLKQGMEEGDDFGIWGGVTPRQRRILKSKHPNKTCMCGTETRCYVHY